MSDIPDQGDAPVRHEANPSPAHHDDTVSLLDLLAVFARRWRLIFFTTFFAAIGVVLFSVYTVRLPPDSPRNPLPNFYRSEAQILLATPSGGRGSIAGTDLGILSGLVGLSGQGASSSAALAEELVRGNVIVDALIDEFGLMDRYSDADSPRTAARESIRENLTTEFDSSSGIMTVGFEDIDPVFAADVLTRVVTQLEGRFLSITRDRSVDRTRALEGQLQRLGDELDGASKALADFQRRHGVIDPVAQGQRTLALVDGFQQQLFDLELQREQVLSIVQNPEDPQVRRIDQSIDRVEGLLVELRTGYRVYTPLSIPLNQIADLSVQYADLERNFRLKQQVYTSFQAELISAQIEAQDTSRQFQILEAPEVPLVKAGPSRGTISMIVTITAFFLSVFTAFVLEYFARAGDDPEEARKIALIKSQFRFRRNRE